MYFVLGCIAMITYALQNSLMAKYYRSMDTLSATMYRGLSLGLTMLPLFAFARVDSLPSLTDHLGSIAAAACLAALGNWCSALSVRFFPVGIAHSLMVGSVVTCTSLIGFLALGESLTIKQSVLICLIVLGNTLLGFEKQHIVLITKRSVLLGLLFSFLFGFLLSLSYVFLAEVSRNVDPYIAAYTWETLIGVAALAIALIRWLIVRVPIERASARTFGTILLYSAPTAVATACYTSAINVGPITIVTAVVSGQFVVATIFAYFFYKESLSIRSWALTGLILCAIIGLKLTYPLQ